MEATISEKNDFDAASSGSYIKLVFFSIKIITSNTFAHTSHNAELRVSPNLIDPREDEYMIILQC